MSSTDAPAIDTTIYRLDGWRRAVLWPLAFLVRLWGRSLRFELDPRDLPVITRADVPRVIILWHNRLFVGAEIYRRYRGGRKAFGLVSASRDGAWLAAFFSLLNLGSVRGSSSRLGREAAQALVERLRAGFDAGITPDGPRGPVYDFKGGGAIVPRRARAPVLLLGAACPASWRLKSWDGFYLPKPFSRVRIRCAEIGADVLRDQEEVVSFLREELMRINPDGAAETPAQKVGS